MDVAHKRTDKLIAKIERQLTKEYSNALKDMQGKLDDYLSKFAKKEAIKAKEVAEGKLAQADYIKWRYGQIMTSQGYRKMRDTLAMDLTMVDKKAMSIVNGYRPEAYALNFNYATYEVENGLLVDTSFTLYSRDAIERIIRDNPALLPNYAKNKTINIAKDFQWNKSHINSAIMQGILQGESITKVSRRLQTVTNMDRAAAIRNTRTAMTSAQNGGREDGYRRAQKMGIKLKRQWVATLDGRTRESHRLLDGQVRNIDEPFDSEFGKIMFPADPQAEPADTYNCRCTLTAVLEGFESDLSDLSIRNDSKMAGMTYDDWKKSKPTYNKKN